MLPHPPPWAAAILGQFGTAPDPETGGVSQQDAMALAHLTSPATVAALLLPGLSAQGEMPAPLDAASIAKSRTLNRFRRKLGEQWVTRISDAGFDIVVMKGAASAHLIYATPDDRGLSDVDVLIRPEELAEVCAFLENQGCRFADMPTRSRWGFVSDASFQPLITPDGAGNIDLHIHPDAWPLHRALGSAEMLARASRNADGLNLPHPDHHFLIMASHAARDLFGANAMKGIVDGLVMLSGPGPRPDIDAVRQLAKQAGLQTAIDSFLAILMSLGAPHQTSTPHSARHSTILKQSAQMIADLFPDGTELGTLDKLIREFTIAAGPRVALTRMAKRAAGLVRRSSGLPTDG